MQAAHKWEKPVDLLTAIGPVSLPGSFSARWWTWWGRSQPVGRVNKKGQMVAHAHISTAKWENLGKMVGRNGVLLYMGSLLWWGEAAAQSDDTVDLLKDWNLAVADVAAALAKALEAVGTR
ncbi:hypothetical protein C8R47DRAFT_993375 [Mycena vitilis]|nr:hypothetical protein C8R47DRAFT_993375 [Mycena vitilis]